NSAPPPATTAYRHHCETMGVCVNSRRQSRECARALAFRSLLHATSYLRVMPPSHLRKQISYSSIFFLIVDGCRPIPLTSDLRGTGLRPSIGQARDNLSQSQPYRWQGAAAITSAPKLQ